jgi:hypothetical protein
MAPTNDRKRAASLPSPSKSKRLATGSATSSAKKTSVTTKKQAATKPLSSLGFSSSKRPAVQVGVKLLLDDSIYHGNCPPEVKKHLFVYEVVQLHENGKTAQVKYVDQVVKEGGNRFTVYKEGDDVQASLGFLLRYGLFVLLLFLTFLFFLFISFVINHST